MAKAVKRSNGSWRCLVYSHTSDDGKRHYKSFSASTKKEAERQANAWKATEAVPVSDLTFGEAAEKYIATCRVTLSPTTTDKYDSMNRTHLKTLAHIKLSSIDNLTVQAIVDAVAVNHSPKTVSCVYGLITAVTRRYMNGYAPTATLPKPVKPKHKTPNNNDIKILMDYVKDKPIKVAVMLAAYGPMRRGEICALNIADVHDNVIHVCKNMVQTKGECVIKSPKSYRGDRYIEIPAFVIEAVNEAVKGREDGRVFPHSPRGLTQQWYTVCKKTGLNFKFHDLRHYSVSIMHALGVPDLYVTSRSGMSKRVLQDVYLGQIDDVSKTMNDRINNYFEQI